MRNPKSEIRNPKFKRDGAAIMLALWAIFLLSALVISWALDIDSRLSLSGDATRMLQAEAAACSGAEVALHPMVTPGSSNLSGQVGNGANYEARLTGEGGRINVNWIVISQGPERELKLEILRKYLENKEVDLNERNTMIDSFLDWIEPNTGLHRLNAPPESEDYHPPHALLTQIDELKKVAGWAQFTAAPGWDDDFTVSTPISSPIDIGWASRDVLLALPGFTPQIVDRFLQLRQGPDGMDGTQDDLHFNGIPDAAVALGLRAEQLKPLEKLITVNSAVFRVVSIGTAGKATRTVKMVFSRNTGGGLTGIAPSVITWKEF